MTPWPCVHLPALPPWPRLRSSTSVNTVPAPVLPCDCDPPRSRPQPLASTLFSGGNTARRGPGRGKVVSTLSLGRPRSRQRRRRDARRSGAQKPASLYPFPVTTPMATPLWPWFRARRPPRPCSPASVLPRAHVYSTVSPGLTSPPSPPASRHLHVGPERGRSTGK